MCVRVSALAFVFVFSVHCSIFAPFSFVASLRNFASIDFVGLRSIINDELLCWTAPNNCKYNFNVNSNERKNRMLNFSLILYWTSNIYVLLKFIMKIVYYLFWILINLWSLFPGFFHPCEKQKGRKKGRRLGVLQVFKGVKELAAELNGKRQEGIKLIA